MNQQAAATAAAATNVSPYVGLAIAFAAFAISALSLIVSLRKYSADATTPWVQILLKYVEDELKDLAKDAGLFLQLYSVPFQTVERKKEVVLALNTVRDESLRRLDALEGLTGLATKLRDKRAELNQVTDSYFDNSELSLPAGIGPALASHYKEHLRQYAGELQGLARTMCKRKGIFPSKWQFGRKK